MRRDLLVNRVVVEVNGVERQEVPFANVEEFVNAHPDAAWVKAVILKDEKGDCFKSYAQSYNDKEGHLERITVGASETTVWYVNTDGIKARSGLSGRYMGKAIW